MLIGVNKSNQIKQIKEITDVTLTIIELDETAETYPFKGWSDTKILCYCYKAGGNGMSIYPYVDTNIIDKLEAEHDRSVKNRSDIDYIVIMTDIDLGV